MAHQPTRTINKLHFTDLDPLRFEDLCLNLVARLYEWKKLNHFGRKGADGGVDIHAVQQVGQESRVWFIQCKRYTAIIKTDITHIIDEVSKNEVLPYKLLIIIACDLTRANYEYCQTYAKSKGIQETEVWAAGPLEARLYKDHQDLLFVYFGVKLGQSVRDNATKIKAGLSMEKKFHKDIINHVRVKDRNQWERLMYEPYHRFISTKVFIHSVDDTTYPEWKETLSAWFPTFFYNTYHNGVEFWLSAGIGVDILMNADGQWEALTDRNDARRNDSKFKVVRGMRIGRVPYYNIVGYKVDGDEYYSEPHLFCKFTFDRRPYEEIYYRSMGIASDRRTSIEFNKSKEVKYPDKLK
ncbi:restriction endonuclease [uncultured Fibrella sp.]|uniref:restriction endonuclease n=1 Tax=uncultured Fibrella sp. TaxID=1284596 RepID=UPI0035CB21B7